MRSKNYVSPPASQIELEPRSSMTIHNLPDCAVNESGMSGGKFLSGHGEWELTKQPFGYVVDVRIEEGGSIPPGGYAAWLRIMGRRRHYELEMTIGDPDSGERLRYVEQ